MPSKVVQRSTPGNRSLTFVHKDCNGTYSTWCWESWLCPWWRSCGVSAPSLQRVHHHLCWGDSQAPSSPSQSNRSHRTRARVGKERKRCQTRKSPLEGNLCEFASWWGKLCPLQLLHSPDVTFPKICDPQFSSEQINEGNPLLCCLLLVGRLKRSQK